MNLGLHAWLNYQATGQLGASSPLLISAAFFIFVQSRMISRLHSGDATVRTMLAVITVLRVFSVAVTMHLLYAIMPALVLLPGIAAVFQLVALGLVFLPPGNAYFARRAPALR